MCDSGLHVGITFVISGPGGVGKGTLAQALVRADKNLVLSRSWTTRDRRSKESADAYRFVSDAEFQKKIDQGGFLEWVEFLGRRYGTPLPETPPGKDLVLEIELQGAKRVRELRDDVVLVLIEPPSIDALVERLRKRGETAERTAERVANGRRELALGIEIADERVINDDLDTAVQSLRAIIQRHRERKANEPARQQYPQ